MVNVERGLLNLYAKYGNLLLWSIVELSMYIGGLSWQVFFRSGGTLCSQGAKLKKGP